jgi:hypothetical protein
MSVYRFKSCAARLFLVLIVAAGAAACGGEDDDGFQLLIQRIEEGEGLPDDPADGYPDEYQTPLRTTIALTRVELIGSGETENVTLLERAPEDAEVIELDEDAIDELIDVEDPVDFPSGCPCTYDQVEFTIAWVEYEIEALHGGNLREHRIRLYAASFTDEDLDDLEVRPGDVLIEDNGAFYWIDAEDGDFVLPDPDDSDQNRPELQLVVPEARFPDNRYDGPATLDLEEDLELERKPKGIVDVTLSVDLRDAFFFDDVDENGEFDIDPDGELNLNDINSRYYPDFPRVSADAAE